MAEEMVDELRGSWMRQFRPRYLPTYMNYQDDWGITDAGLWQIHATRTIYATLWTRVLREDGVTTRTRTTRTTNTNTNIP